MRHNEPVWHREVLNSDEARTLGNLQTLGVLERWYLAGGTGLALHLGHRRSHDLDFMTADPVDPEALIHRMQTLSGFAVAAVAPETLHATVQGTKVSFLAYPYPVLFPFAAFLGVNVADPRDIACMKLSAIASRGVRRDFVDLYFVARQYGLEQLLAWFGQKYATVRYSRTHLLKSLQYFEAVDCEPMPDLLTPLTWDDVKQFFAREVARLSA